MIKKTLIFAFCFVMVALPVITFAANDSGLLNGLCISPTTHEFSGADCNFGDLLKLITNVINFLIYLSIPLAAIAFAWAGWIMVTSGGSESKKDHAKEIFTKVAIGFIFVLGAWLIVRFITSALLNSSNYQDLLNTSNVKEQPYFI